MDRRHHRVAHAGHCAEQVGARAQMRDFAQELHRVLLGLDRVGLRIVDEAGYRHLMGLNLETLALALRGHQGAGDDHARAGGEVLHLVFVIRDLVGDHGLDRVEAGAIAHIDEGQARLRIAPGADPAAHGHGVAGFDAAGKSLLNTNHRHGLKLLLGAAYRTRKTKFDMIMYVSFR